MAPSKKVSVALTIPAEWHDRLLRHAFATHQSPSEIVSVALKLFFAQLATENRRRPRLDAGLRPDPETRSGSPV